MEGLIFRILRCLLIPRINFDLSRNIIEAKRNPSDLDVSQSNSGLTS